MSRTLHRRHQPVDVARRHETLDIPEASQPVAIEWDYLAVLALVHAAALLAFLPWFFSWVGVATAVAGHFLFGMLGITIGYHRLLTHQGFTCPKWFEHALALLGICTLQDSPARWVAIHRIHHKESDQQPDPHSPQAGFFWGHVGWLLVKNRDHRNVFCYERYVRDLLRDPFYVALERRRVLLESPDAEIRARAAALFSAPAPLSPDELAALTTAVRRGGDQSRGRDVFARHCANCHRAASPGGEPIGHTVGPDLAEAADRPIERLLADIVDPNRAVEPRYEATVVVTDDGTVHDGILQASTADAVTLARAGGERVMIPRDAIESIRGIGKSLMPEGFGRAIPATEFADLLAFLRAGRPVGPPQ